MRIPFGSGTGDYFAAKYNGNTVSSVVGGKTETVQKIGTCICNCQVNRFLCTGNHDRSPVILDQIGQGSCGVSHGISAVTDHEPVVEFVFFSMSCASCSQWAARTLVLSRAKGCTVSIVQNSLAAGIYFSSSSAEICGESPSWVYFEAIVPPVAISRIFFS